MNFISEELLGILMLIAIFTIPTYMAYYRKRENTFDKLFDEFLRLKNDPKKEDIFTEINNSTTRDMMHTMNEEVNKIIIDNGIDPNSLDPEFRKTLSLLRYKRTISSALQETFNEEQLKLIDDDVFPKMLFRYNKMLDEEE